MQIKVKKLTHTFSVKTPWEFTALKDVSATIKQGEYVGIIGATGSGKTTLIEHLNRLLEPTNGVIEWVYKDNIRRTYNYELSKLLVSLDKKYYDKNDPKYKAELKEKSAQIKKEIKANDKQIKELEKIYKKEYKIAYNKFSEEYGQHQTERKSKLKNKFKFSFSKEVELFKNEFDANSETLKKINELKYVEDFVTQQTYKSKIKSLRSMPKKIRQRVAIAFQFAEYQLFKGTIIEDIAFGPMAYGVPKIKAYEKARECLKLVGLGEEYLERSPFELSGGQKRRVALAGILAMEPDFLVVDEPTAGLDPQGVDEILEILNNLHKSGKTIINVTHDLDNILKYSKRILLMKNGQIVNDGEPYDVLNDVEFLKENNLQPPHLLEFANKLRKRGVDIPKVTSEEELAFYINKHMESKKGV